MFGDVVNSGLLSMVYLNIYPCSSVKTWRKQSMFGLPDHKPSSVQFSHSVMSNSMWHHGLQHIRLPCPSPTPWVYSNSCALSQWCYPTISSSVAPFSSHLQSLPASGSFQMSQLFASGDHSIGASASVLPVNIQGWFSLGWTGWISLQSKGLTVKSLL